MRILVTAKEVAEIDDEFEIRDLGVDPDYVRYSLNEWDSYAIEEAVRFREANDDVDVITVTVGPKRSEETVRMALAKGADRAIRVWDDALAEATHVDVAARARILAAIVESESPDLIFTGVQSADTADAATGVALAERIGFGWAAVVNDLDVDFTEGIASLRRELEGGIEEMTDVRLPAVFTIQTGINEPRYASLRGIRQAQQKPLDVKELNDLGIDESVLTSPIRLTDVREPESEGDVEIWEGSPEKTAEELAGLLQERGVI